ncbi:MAG: hypothetical protein IPI73_30110 [Betaproteobacteria bacterium]|nr:hypothetical protein [Betaproteobacteria bacterium]
MDWLTTLGRKVRCFVVPGVAACLLAAQPLLAEDGIRGNLVSVQWLEKNLHRDDVLLLDASPGQMHSMQHIPGAINVDVFTWGGREMTAAEMERRIQSWGVSAGRKVVIYDQGGSYMATSLFFDLYYHGFPAADLFVLDGGIAKWKATGGAVTKDPGATPKPGSSASRNAGKTCASGCRNSWLPPATR